MHVYTGAYTEEQMGHAEGIGLVRFDPASGEIGPVEATTPARNPSYLALSADRTRLYAVDELEEGAVSAFRRDAATGALERINGQSTGGAHPCYLSLDSTGRFLLAANYTGGNLAVFPIAEDGSLNLPARCWTHEGSSIDPSRQGEPHPHMILPSPDGRFVYVTDLGIDRWSVTGSMLNPAPSPMSPRPK